MQVDGYLGTLGGAAAEDLAALREQVRRARRCGLAGLWSTEVSRDPFLPLAVAAGCGEGLALGTAVAVAPGRSPTVTASAAHDLHALSDGRFTLGLGSQVEAHVRRRLGMPWSSPAAWMREYVQAVQAVWACWQEGGPLRFEGEHYRLDLMPPLFRPAPNPAGVPRVVLAAVGPQMLRVAAEVADGVVLHAFSTERHLAEQTLPALAGPLHERGLPRDRFAVLAPVLVATGSDPAQLDAATAAVRQQVAFYAATPAYRQVLAVHGWEPLHERLHALSRQGEWDEMARLVDDDVLHAVAVVGPPREAARALHARFAGRADRVTLLAPYDLDEQAISELVGALPADDPAGGPA